MTTSKHCEVQLNDWFFPVLAGM